MSGVKDMMITMPQSQRDKLLNSAKRAKESAEQAARRERAAKKALDDASKQLDSLNNTLNNEIAGLHEDMQQMAKEQNQRHLRQTQEHQRHLQQQADSFSRSIEDVNARMESQRVALNNSIEQVRQQGEQNRQQLQSAIDNVSSRIDARDSSHKSLAEFWISQAQTFIWDIDQYRHNMFAPGQLSKLQNELNTILQQEMAQEAYQTAMASARAAFNNVVELKGNVLNAEEQWAISHSAYVSALADTQSNLEAMQNLQFTIEMEHGDETVDANIDYWADNALQHISKALDDIKTKNEKIQEVPTAELIKMLDTMVEINTQMEAAANKAKEALISSQQRAEMANRITGALADCGWDFHEEKDGVAYEGNEFNRPVHVKMSDGMDNEIVAIISPDDNLANNLELNFFYETNDYERQQAWIQSMKNSLEEGGLNVSNPTCRPGYVFKASDAHELRDIQATAARKS
ncbi:MAG: hypothetical protein FWC77_06430 [Defluviitaleaceae bacterium]|nr:hypothetical protein [Defluviitaleaceae bacterium]